MKSIIIFLSCVLVFCSGTELCPSASEISPCTCNYDADLDRVNIYCEEALRETDISHAFSAEFPRNDLYGFFMVGNRFVNYLTQPVFNGKTFQYMNISDSILYTIDESVFQGQEDTLR